MLEIHSFVDHKLAVFTYFKHIFSPCTSQRSTEAEYNLACSVKQRTGCEMGQCVCDMSVKQSKVGLDLVNRRVKFKE